MQPQDRQYGYVVTPQERALVRKQDLRVLPLSALCYFILNLDRSNIGNAKTMNADTHDDLLSETNMTDQGYTISLMIFFVIYAYAAPAHLDDEMVDCYPG
jgi:hypothetical protein